MSRSVEETLEFGELRGIVARYSTFGPGFRMVRSLEPCADAVKLREELALVGEGMACLREDFELRFASVPDPETWLARLAIENIDLTAKDALDVVSLLDSVNEVKQSFPGKSGPCLLLTARAVALADFRHLTREIRRTILPNGEISDAASPALKRIRSEKVRTRGAVQQSLQKILQAREQEAGEGYITLRNGRFVIPVRASERRTLPGVVHAASDSKQTLFVEPFETVELNNRLVQLDDEEQAEIRRILAEITARLRGERDALSAAVSILAKLDSVFARARFARDFLATLPEISQTVALRLEAARNPVLEDTMLRQRRESGKERRIVPITFELGGEETVMVISGPNTGGKTVALKTAGLAALAGQSGIPVAAERAALPIFDCVLADIGDEQSIAADLSTFSAHMLNLKRMLEKATERSLVLVDELGTGTAPEEGAALALALLERFRERRSLTIATTHHDRLKTYASMTRGVVNAAVEFDSVNLRPTYRLLTGVPGISSGIEIAQRLGLPERVIEQARAGLAPETREASELIAYLHRSRDEMERLQRQAKDEIETLATERRALQTEWLERQKKRIAELEKQFAQAVKLLEADVARLAAEIADRKTRSQAEKQAARGMAKIAGEARANIDAAVLAHLAASQEDLGAKLVPMKPVAAEELAEGMRVRIRGMKEPAILRRRDEKSAEIQAGPLRMKIPLADILGIEAQTEASESPGVAQHRRVTVHSAPPDEPASEEINVIGDTVEEASRRVDKFLDVAALGHVPRIRIIHGHGTGALRRGLAEFLAAHPLVENFHAEAEDRGGAAITVVELKA